MRAIGYDASWSKMTVLATDMGRRKCNEFLYQEVGQFQILIINIAVFINFELYNYDISINCAFDVQYLVWNKK